MEELPIDTVIRYELVFYNHIFTDRPILLPEAFVEKALGGYSEIFDRNLTAGDFIIRHKEGDSSLYVETAFTVYLDEDEDVYPSLDQIDTLAEEAGIGFYEDDWSYRTEDFSTLQ